MLPAFLNPKIFNLVLKASHVREVAAGVFGSDVLSG